jgi:hypothetical protein
MLNYDEENLKLHALLISTVDGGEWSVLTLQPSRENPALLTRRVADVSWLWLYGYWLMVSVNSAHNLCPNRKASADLRTLSVSFCDGFFVYNDALLPGPF